MSATLTTAYAAKYIAEQLIPAHHPHLADRTILYLFTDAKRAKSGKTVLGTAQKSNPLQQYLSRTDRDDADDPGIDFILIFGQQEWSLLSEAQRRALVDHELMHCQITMNTEGDLVPTLRAHDFEGFREEIERHGLWKQDMRDIADAMQQLRLPIDERVRA